MKLLACIILLLSINFRPAHQAEPDPDDTCDLLRLQPDKLLAASPMDQKYFMMLTTTRMVYQLPLSVLKIPDQNDGPENREIRLNLTATSLPPPVPIEIKWPKLWSNSKFQESFIGNLFNLVWFTEDKDGWYVCFASRNASGRGQDFGFVYNFKTDELMDGYRFAGLKLEGGEKVS